MSADRLVDAVADHCAALAMSGATEPLFAIHVIGGRGAYAAGVLVDERVVAKSDGPSLQAVIDQARSLFAIWSANELNEEFEAKEGIARLNEIAQSLPANDGAQP